MDSSTNGVKGDGRMSSNSNLMRSYNLVSTFGGIGEPPSWWVGTAVESLKKGVLNSSAWNIKEKIFRYFLIIRKFHVGV